MSKVRPKKFLGQHFLTDTEIALKITEALLQNTETNNVLEIGPGTGVLTQFLVADNRINLKVIEIDSESIDYLKKNKLVPSDKIISGDFLHYPLLDFFHEQFSIIGNFPYNISSQILFRMLENRQLVPQLVGMLQKEVAIRICARPGKKEYGILSVFLQAFYDTEYLFTVDEHVFNPPPKVKSGVIRLIRKKNFALGTDEKQFYMVVKMAFNQRRKTLRNALKQLLHERIPPDLSYLSQRAEELSFADFVLLTNIIFSR